MLYKFKSKATGDLIMLEPQGRQILQIIGKEPGPKGIILPEEMSRAIDDLHDAVKAEEEIHQEADEAQASGPRTISLKQRVVPFVDMLRRALAEDKEVVWGV
jgi:cyclopropane-fatty-acyl-phospholipid synthase